MLNFLQIENNISYIPSLLENEVSEEVPIYHDTIFAPLRMIFIVIMITAILIIIAKYKKLVKKTLKTNEDIKKREKYINILSILLIITINAIPFILNSLGINIIGHLDITLQSTEIFIEHGVISSLIITIIAFLSDNILTRIISPILTINETHELDKFCLYLRSFCYDDNKEEKRICKVAKRLYPVYAVGDPDKVLQPNGAERIYLIDDDWQDTVRRLSIKSKLILLRIGRTDGTLWEISNIIKEQLVHKTIFIADNQNDLKFFIDNVSTQLGLNADLNEDIKEKTVAFFWDSNNTFRKRIIVKSKDIEKLINEFLSTNPELDKLYEKDLDLRHHNLKYIFDKDRIPITVRRSLNWRIIAPIVNMRNWSLTIMAILFIFMIMSFLLKSLIPIYLFLFLIFLYGNRIEWAAGCWSSDKMFLKKIRRETLVLWSCLFLGLYFSTFYIIFFRISYYISSFLM